MSDPRISVVIPMHNASQYIEQTLHSVLQQSVADFEVVVVDDLSTDSGPELVNQIAAQDPRVRVLRNAENVGVCASRNKGYVSATGRYVMFLDSDDLISLTALEVLSAVLDDSDASVAMSYGAVVHMDESGTVQIEPSIPHQRDNTVEGWLQFNGVGSGSGALIRREYLENTGGFDESLRDEEGEGCADWLFYLNIRRHFEAVYVPLPTVGYRIIRTSMSANPAAMINGVRSMYHRIRIRFPELSPALEDEGLIWAGMYYLGRGILNRSAAEVIKVLTSLNPLQSLRATFRLYRLSWSPLYWRKIRRRWGLSRGRFPRWTPVTFQSFCDQFESGGRG